MKYTKKNLNKKLTTPGDKKIIFSIKQENGAVALEWRNIAFSHNGGDMKGGCITIKYEKTKIKVRKT